MDDKASVWRQRLSTFSAWAGAKTRAAMTWAARNLVELVATAGAASLTMGVYQISSAVGDITRGVLLMVGAVCLATSRRGRG